MKLKRLLALTASAFLALSLAVLPNTSFAAMMDGVWSDWNGTPYPYRYGWVYLDSSSGWVHAFWTEGIASDPWGPYEQGGAGHSCDFRNGWGGASHWHSPFSWGDDRYTVWAANIQTSPGSFWDGRHVGYPSERTIEGMRFRGLRAGYWKNNNTLHWTCPIAWWGGNSLMNGNCTASTTDLKDPNTPALGGTNSGWVKNAPTISVSATDQGDKFIWWDAHVAIGEWRGRWADRNLRTTSGINHYEYSVGNSSSWIGMPTNVSSIRFATPGENTLYFRAIDNTHRSSGVVSTTVKLDDKAPTVTATPSTYAWVDQLTINVSTEDKNSNGTLGSQTNRIEWQRAGDSTWQTIYGGAGSATITRNGTYYFRAIDNVGWVSSTASVVVNNVDEIPPTVSVDWNKSPVKETDLKITAADVGGGLTGWAVTDSLAVPSDGQWQPLSNLANFKTDYHITENKPYYIHVKDVANNHAVVLADVKSLDRYAPVIFQIQVKGGS